MTASEASAIAARAIAQPRTARKSPNACEPYPTAMTGTVSPTYANTKKVEISWPRV